MTTSNLWQAGFSLLAAGVVINTVKTLKNTQDDYVYNQDKKAKNKATTHKHVGYGMW